MGLTLASWGKFVVASCSSLLRLLSDACTSSVCVFAESGFLSSTHPPVALRLQVRNSRWLRIARRQQRRWALGHKMTQQARGGPSPKLSVSFSKLLKRYPTLHCNPRSPIRASLQYETYVSHLTRSCDKCSLTQSSASHSLTTDPIV